MWRVLTNQSALLLKIMSLAKKNCSHSGQTWMIFQREFNLAKTRWFCDELTLVRITKTSFFCRKIFQRKKCRVSKQVSKWAGLAVCTVKNEGGQLWQSSFCGNTTTPKPMTRTNNATQCCVARLPLSMKSSRLWKQFKTQTMDAQNGIIKKYSVGCLASEKSFYYFGK